MRKILFIILLLLLTGCTTFSDVTEIEAVNLQNGINIIISKDSKDADIIQDAVNKKNKTDEDVSSLLNYEITLKKDNAQEVCIFYFDLDNQAAYIAQNKTLYKVNDNAARKLFLSDVFSYIYVSTIYDSYIELNGKKLSPDIEYNWNSKNIEGHFIKNAGILTGKYEKNDKIPVSQSDSIDIKHEKKPDNQIIRVYSEGSLLSTGKELREVLSNIKSDGEYQVECESQWHFKQDSQSYGSQKLKFPISVDIPAEINIVTKENYPGNILLISIENLNADETVKLNTDAVKIDNDIYAYKDKNYYMIPIDLYTQPGNYDVTAVVNEGAEDEYTLEKTLNVSNRS
ncbi:MAG: hypothetical protein PHP29_10155, partial [Tissierellia bacterium]|nr:hypothetical protein [Tissierellia bacterium]